MTDRMTPNQPIELADDLLETVPAGLDVMESDRNCVSVSYVFGATRRCHVLCISAG